MRATLTHPGGPTIVFEGDPAAVGVAVAKYELTKKLGAQEPVSVTPEGNPWDRFVERVGDKPEQLAVLRLLKEQGPYALNQLADILQAEDTRKLGGLLGAIRRTTLRAGFSSTDGVIAKKGRMYMPGPALTANVLPPVPSNVTRYDRIRENLDEEEP